MVTRDEWSDVFDNQAAPRTNVIDLASHYPYNPERHTVLVNGTRQLIQYGSISQYNHAGDVHELKPAAGETVVLRSAERPRYVVAYELKATFAWSVNQSLQSGDSIKIGLYDGSNGWYLEHTGAMDDTTADFVAEKNSTELYREESVDLEQAVTAFGRLGLETAWYKVSRQKWDMSFPDNKSQRNPGILRASGDDGPEYGNLPLWFEVTASASTTNLVLNAGSAAQINRGKTTDLRRIKTAVHTDTVDTTGSWIPIRAYRIDPAREIVHAEVRNLSIGQYSVADDIELFGIACDPSKITDTNGNALTDSDFSVPNAFNSQNNPLETTTAVEQFPDNTGTITTSATNPGGWQLGRAELYSGSGNSISGANAGATSVTRTVYSRDYLVILAKSASTGDVDYRVEFELDW